MFEDDFKTIDPNIWGYEIQRGGFGYVILCMKTQTLLEPFLIFVVATTANM